MYSKIATLTLLVASASAAAVPANSTPWLWHLTGVTSTCTAATCRYSFNVSAPAGPGGEPPFDATGCIGTSVQGDFKSCAIVGVDVPGDVLSNEMNSGIDIGAVIKVQYTFTQNGMKYTYTGGNAIAHGGPPADMDITPTDVYAVPAKK
ncbi:hypothetical protein GQ44DRAFT_632386 [Phaeosphaeriaceae sp. PMI808]|nr:hypothetical protein GQ44DRAFT_632386 [Phaeosphaeriaceae sp. PMI808]